MFRAALIAALGLSLSQVTFADEIKPLDCPQCGIWKIVAASPSGATGEQIVVSSEHISIPTCGEFDSELKEQSSSLQDQQRTYEVSLQLKTAQPDSLCKLDEGEVLILKIKVSVGYRADGGLGEFNVYKTPNVDPVFTANAWNYSRDNPCDSGSGYGSAACLEHANAKLIKALAYESYVMDSGRGSDNKFNAARYAAATMRFCAAREANRGMGNWPYAWALDCQAGYLEVKLEELRSFAACRATSKRSACKKVTEKFDRSPKKEE